VIGDIAEAVGALAVGFRCYYLLARQASCTNRRRSQT
jgi:hypothetical protein